MVGVLLLLPSDPLPFMLIPESRACRAPGFLAAVGRLAGGIGLFLPAPFIPGGGGGDRGISTGAGACSSTYAAGIHACAEPFLASHQPKVGRVSMRYTRGPCSALTIIFFLNDLNDIARSDG